MEYKDNELTLMMNAIKNLKKKNMDNSNNVDIKNKDVEEEKNRKDTSFYDRIFHHSHGPQRPVQKPIINECKERDFLPNNSSQIIEDYFSSEEFHKKMEEMVSNLIMNSVKNKDYMEKLINTVILEYTNSSSALQQYIENTVEAEITKIIRQCINNVGKTLLAV